MASTLGGHGGSHLTAHLAAGKEQLDRIIDQAIIILLLVGYVSVHCVYLIAIFFKKCEISDMGNGQNGDQRLCRQSST
jgi:hypothetical protein